MTSWQDPTVIVAAAVGVISLASVVVTIVNNLKQQSRKAITYELLSDESVLNSGGMQYNAIEVRLRDTGQVVDNLNHVIYRFRNSGIQDIKRDDIDVPIQITFGGQAEVISCGFTLEVPIHPSFKGNTVTVIIDSMNRKEEFGVGILVTGYTKRIRYQGHIVGGVFSERKVSRSRSFSAYWLGFTTASLALLACFLTVELTDSTATVPRVLLTAYTGMTIASLLVFILQRPLDRLSLWIVEQIRP